MTEYWNYIVTGIGLIGFWMAGKKIWWCWYINIFNQILWMVFGLTTEQYGFVVGSLFYTVVFAKNAHAWTKEHLEGSGSYGWRHAIMTGAVSVNEARAALGKATSVTEDDRGLSVDIKLNEDGMRLMARARETTKSFADSLDAIDHDYLDSTLRASKVNSPYVDHFVFGRPLERCNAVGTIEGVSYLCQLSPHTLEVASHVARLPEQDRVFVWTDEHGGNFEDVYPVLKPARVHPSGRGLFRKGKGVD